MPYDSYDQLTDEEKRQLQEIAEEMNQVSIEILREGLRGTSDVPPSGQETEQQSLE